VATVVAVTWAVAFVGAQIGVPGKDIPQLSDEELARILPEAPGRELVKRICGSECHTVAPVAAHSGDASYWDGIVYDMTLQGAQVTGEEKASVVGYLSSQFPPRIDVNLAGASALQAQLGFTAEQAAAIVAHRAANGPFSSIDALKKVAGLPADKVDAVSRRLTFGAR
jgi:hypothetical protein